jgi:tetratricopeptide (TPR) repeat protein
MLERGIIVLVAASLLAIMTSAAADDRPDWVSGQRAFASGDYGAALRHFEAARNHGLKGPAVHYNIAVCLFSLGEFDRARDTFRYIAGHYPRMRGLAEYNMGLTERRLGNNNAAQRHFIRAFELSEDDEKIRALAISLIRETEIERASEWYGSAGLRIGHDDNVALRDSTGLPAGVSGESPLADLFVTVRGPIPGAGRLLVDASVYAINYTDASDFDQTEIRTGGLYTWQNDDWWAEGGVFFTHGTVGGSYFNREFGLHARAVRFLNENSSLEFHIRQDDVSSASSRFEGIDGDRQRLGIRYRYYDNRNDISARVSIEKNDRLDAGVSPSRIRWQLDYRYVLNDAWQLEAGALLRASDYDDLVPGRSEDLTSLTAGTAWSFRDAWQATLAWQYSRNDASDPAFSYERNQLTLGMYRSF